MERNVWRLIVGIPLAFVALLSLGCTNSNSSPPSSGTKTGVMTVEVDRPQNDSKSSENHQHPSGAHGGMIVSLGRDSYHVEAIIERGGTLILYTLGADESRIMEVDAQDLMAYVKRKDSTEAVAIAVTPRPQPGDKEGKVSLFVAQLPAEVLDKSIDITVPSIVIAGERFRLSFATGSDGDHAEDSMPVKVADAQERELYLSPGGLYTTEDIAANGNVTASEKFKGVMAKHDLKPKAGDVLCPITLTKANPSFSWVVGGKAYEFCCPPCVDEFVGMAKRNSPDVLAPGEYIKR